MSVRRVLLFLLVILVGCTASSETSTSSLSVVPSPTVAPVPATCPRNISAKQLGKNDLPGITHALVPGDPQVLVICEMPRFGSGNPKRIVVADSTVVSQITDALNRMKLTPQGSLFNCPVNYGPQPEAGLFFNYPDGGVLLVKVGLCPLATNGRRAAMGPSSIWRLIQQAQQDAPT